MAKRMGLIKKLFGYICFDDMEMQLYFFFLLKGLSDCEEIHHDNWRILGKIELILIIINKFWK